MGVEWRFKETNKKEEGRNKEKAGERKRERMKMKKIGERKGVKMKKIDNEVNIVKKKEKEEEREGKTRRKKVLKWEDENNSLFNI